MVVMVMLVKSLTQISVRVKGGDINTNPNTVLLCVLGH